MRRAHYDPLFACGYGLSLGDGTEGPSLSEDAVLDAAAGAGCPVR